MVFDKTENGELDTRTLTDFEVLNILEKFCVLGLQYECDDGQATIQLRLSPEQCRELAKRLLLQAKIFEIERTKSAMTGETS